MEYQANGGQFDAHRLMQIHEGLKPKPLSPAFKVAVLANLGLMFLSVVVSVALLRSSSGPPVWLVVFEAAAPWIAVGAALCFPKRCSLFGGGSGIPLFGVLFFAALAPRGGNAYASLVAHLTGVEVGSVAGLLLFAVAAVAQIRTKANLQVLVILLPLSVVYGLFNLVQANCVLDHSPSTVYRTVVSSRSSYRGFSLDLEPWGGNPPSKGLLTRYTVSVPRATYDAVEKGGPVCIEQRKGALGLAWFSARPCQ